jgi:hypothetical protein
MLCSKCQQPLPDGAKFCGECGTRQAQEPSAPEAPKNCDSCGNELAASARFCGECGRPVQGEPSAKTFHVEQSFSREADPERLAQYAAELDALIMGGVLVRGALDCLAELRRDLGVSSAQHAALIRERSCFEGTPVGLEYDPDSAWLVEQQPTTLILTTRNLCQGRKMVKSLELQVRCSTSGEVRSRSLGQLYAGKTRRLDIPLDPAPSAGQYVLDGFLQATFRNGAVFRGRLAPLNLRVSSKQNPHSGPSHVSINVDASRAALVKNIGQFAAGGEQDSGKVIGASGHWSPIELTPATEDEFDEWLARAAQARSGTAHRTRLVGEPLPCRGAMLRVKRETTRAPGGVLQDVWFLREDRVTFGRDDTRADVFLAVEPFHPPDQYNANLQASYRISSCHLAFQRGETEATLTDLGSANGTTLDNQRLRANQPQSVRQRSVVRVADALGLEASPLCGDDGLVHALCVQRTDNMPQRSYLLASAGLGLWPDDHRFFGPRQRGGSAAPLALEWHRGGPCIRNRSARGATINGERLRVGQLRALDQRDIVRVEGWVIAVMDFLQERYRG